MAKKKHVKSLRPYQTVVQAKRPGQDPKAEEQPSSSKSPDVSAPAESGDASAPAGQTVAETPAEPVDPRRQRIQELATKLQEKTDKDVSLILRVGPVHCGLPTIENSAQRAQNRPSWN